METIGTILLILIFFVVAPYVIACILGKIKGEMTYRQIEKNHDSTTRYTNPPRVPIDAVQKVTNDDTQEIQRTVRAWRLLAYNINLTMQLQANKEKGELAYNDVAQLDFAIYHFFLLYVDMCVKRRSKEYVKAFMSQCKETLGEEYGHWNSPDVIKEFFDLRIAKYENIVLSDSENMADELFDCLMCFLKNDLYAKDPLAESVFVLPIEKEVALIEEMRGFASRSTEAIERFRRLLLSSRYYVIGDCYYEDEEGGF